MKNQREGQRARKRRLRSLESADYPLQGDGEREEIPRGSGANSGVFERWAEASRADLLLLRRAIREGWPVADHIRPIIVEAIMSKLDTEAPDDPLMAIAVAKIVIAADNADIDAQLAEFRQRRRSR
jgi:hypothetical protein